MKKRLEEITIAVCYNRRRCKNRLGFKQVIFYICVTEKLVKNRITLSVEGNLINLVPLLHKNSIEWRSAPEAMIPTFTHRTFNVLRTKINIWGRLEGGLWTNI